MKKCPLCQGFVVDGSATFTVDLGEGIVVVRDIPAQVCSQCGEEWLDDSTAAKLENIVESARKKHVTVEVARWSEAVA
ncbi:MAG: type II toxin-antitoxin system MqsA family antitoxin [Epsilonproteobacteria bacterium]|nr:type II toxin-antitoxin system MqsA family antitoxin [Campylobacterota bacterium]